MRSTLRAVASLTLVAAISGCGHPKTFDQVTVRRVPPVRPVSTVTLVTPPSPISPIEAATSALRVQLWNDTLVWNTVAHAETPERVEHRTSSSTTIRTGVSASPSAGIAPCDGDLPPCSRIIGTESGGNWNAHNYAGCVEHGHVYECWGPYQFSGSWAGKLGLPLDLWTTTHDQWVNAARELWAGGAGCSNWSAC